MVAKEFLEELRRIRWNFDWTYRGQTRRIRARLRLPGRPLLDPVGVVCYFRTGLLFDEDNWYRAAEYIGLSHIDAADLTAAANNPSNHPEQHYIESLRSEMIEAILLPRDPEGYRILNGVSAKSAGREGIVIQ